MQLGNRIRGILKFPFLAANRKQQGGVTNAYSIWKIMPVGLILFSNCTRQHTSSEPRVQKQISPVYLATKKADTSVALADVRELETAIDIAKDQLVKYPDLSTSKTDKDKAIRILNAYKRAHDEYRGVLLTQALTGNWHEVSDPIILKHRTRAAAYKEFAEKLYYGKNPGPEPIFKDD